MSDTRTRQGVWGAALLVIFSALVLARALSEGVYDLAFANLALDLTDAVSTVGLVYFTGYGVEVLASLVAGPMLDRRSPLGPLIGAYLLKTALFGLIGVGASFLSSNLWMIVVAAALVDLVHQLGEMALFVLLPRVLDPASLVRVQGLGSTVRAAGELLSPVVAGTVLALMPGARALLAAAVLQIVALGLLMAMLGVLRRLPGASARPGSGGPADADGAAAAPVASRRGVATAILASPAWLRYVVLRTTTTVALSSVVLTLFPLLREQLSMSAAQAAAFLAFSTVGSIVGGLLVTRGGVAGISPSLAWAPAVAGTGTVAMPLVGGSEWLLALSLILFGTGFTVFLRSAGLLLQLRAPQHLLGTWNGLLDAVGRTFCAAAILATGFAFDLVGGTTVYLVFGGLLLVTALLWFAFSRDHVSALEATSLHTAAH